MCVSSPLLDKAENSLTLSETLHIVNLSPEDTAQGQDGAINGRRAWARGQVIMALAHVPSVISDSDE